MAFVLHERLAADTAPIGELSLSRVLLMDDSRFPWIILVPRYPSAIEICDLSEADRRVVVEEIALGSKVLQRRHGIEKINIGALGNLVPQLHIHVIGRHKTDAAWPGPVWGFGSRVPYERGARDALVKELAQELRI